MLSSYQNFSSLGDFHQNGQLVLTDEQVTIGDCDANNLAWLQHASFRLDHKELVILDFHLKERINYNTGEIHFK
jgi:hypothetical protein